RDPLAADVVAVRLRDRALRDHADLGAAADHNHAFAVDGLESRHDADVRHTWHGLQVADQAAAVGGAGDLELELGDGFAPRAPGDVCDVGAVAKDRLGDAITHPRL